MRIVLDTNVLVAGLLSPHGPCAEVLRLAFSGHLTLCLDSRIMVEYDEVLRRKKFGFNLDNIEIIMGHITREGLMTVPAPVGVSLPDRDDEVFIEAAVAAGASYLVTGNSGHFPMRLFQGVKIVSPGEFLTRYRRSHKEPDVGALR